MPRQPQELEPKLVARLNKLRARAQQAHHATLSRGPDPTDDLLGAIAWRSAFPEAAPFDETLRLWINEARDKRFTWAEIATACGVDLDDLGAERVQSKQRWRNRLAG